MPGVLELRGVGCWSAGARISTTEKLLKFRIFCDKKFFLKKKG